ANGQLDSALAYYLKAMDMVPIAFGEHSTNEAYFNLLTGNVYFKKNDMDKAMLYYEEGLRVLSDLNVWDQPLNTALENGRAYCKLKTGRLASADSLFKKSMFINQYIDGKFDKIIYLNGFVASVIGLIKLNYEKYKTTGDARFLEQAQTYSEIGTKAMLVKINSTVSYGTKTLFKDKFRDIFEQSLKVQASIGGGKIAQNVLFSLLEKSKQSILRNEVSAILKLYESEVPDSLLDKEMTLNKSIDKWEKKKDEMAKNGMGELDSSRMLASLAIFDLKEKRQKLLDDITDRFPTYSRFKFELNTIGLGKIRKDILGKDKALLEYFVGEESLYAMLVTSDTVEIIEMPINNLNSLIAQLQNGITGFYELPLEDRTDEKYKTTLSDYIAASQKLYDLLIQPFRHFLPKEVIIVPDGKLHLIPFGALLSGPPPAQKDFNTYPFFEKMHAISYCFSASMLYNIKNRKYRDAPAKSLAAFAPFYKSGYQPFFSNQGRDRTILVRGLDSLLNRRIIVRSDFNNLPYSGEEVLTVSSLMEGDVFLDERATINQFYEIIGQYRIVHLSTHGGANNNNGSYSYLVFANKSAEEGGGLLFAKDLYTQNIKADMVVLSACETGDGELKKSEGIVSLAKAFVFAGAKSVITTLWSVEDKSAKNIITDFYRSIKNGERKNVALYNAKNQFLKNNGHSFKHPFFWAGIIPFGDMSAVE
ncbi:MAG TPA: CHAT domain-containing protein, partial [Bacteroidetes bacterium]|nr:CHAT domain-containing protein [Bacteroidota bacterium]